MANRAIPAPESTVRVGAAPGCGLQCCLGQANEICFAMARRTASLGIFSTRNGPPNFLKNNPTQSRLAGEGILPPYCGRAEWNVRHSVPLNAARGNVGSVGSRLSCSHCIRFPADGIVAAASTPMTMA